MASELKIKFQLSLFGDFSKIVPNEQTLTKCIEKFFSVGYIPNAGTQELDPSTNRLEPRLSLQSIRNGIAANIMFGRIDFIANPLPGTPAANLNINEFSEQCLTLTRLFIENFFIEFHRAGFVTELLFGDIGDERLSSARNNFTNPNCNIFKDQEASEWSSKFSNLFQLPEPLNNTINVGHTLSQVQAQVGDQNGQKEFATLHLNIDSNTPTNSKITSTTETLEQFIAFAVEKEHTVSSTIKQVIYG